MHGQYCTYKEPPACHPQQAFTPCRFASMRLHVLRCYLLSVPDSLRRHITPGRCSGVAPKHGQGAH